MKKFRLEPLDEKKLPIVLRWRNSKQIREYMYNDTIINQEEHERWFNKISNSENDKYLVFFIENFPVGLVYFNYINLEHHHCTWGFYIGEKNVIASAGTLMGCLGLEYIFNELNMHKVYGEVLEKNAKSLSYHEKMGFKREGELKEHILKQGKYEGIVLYSLFKKDWKGDRFKQLKERLLDKGIDLFEDCNRCKPQ